MRQPGAIGFGVLIGDAVDGIVLLPFGERPVRPVGRRLRARGVEVCRVFGVGDRRALDVDALARAHDGDVVVARGLRSLPLKQAGVGKAQHAGVDAIPVGDVHLLHQRFHLGHDLLAARLSGSFRLEFGQLVLFSGQNGVVIPDHHFPQFQITRLIRLLLVLRDQPLRLRRQLRLLLLDKIAVLVHVHPVRFIRHRGGWHEQAEDEAQSQKNGDSLSFHGKSASFALMA